MSPKKKFPFLALLITLTPVVAFILFLLDVKHALLAVSILSAIIFSWVITMIGKKIVYALQGKKDPGIKEWERQVTIGGTWYFVTFAACILSVIVLHGVFAG